LGRERDGENVRGRVGESEGEKEEEHTNIDAEEVSAADEDSACCAAVLQAFGLALLQESLIALLKPYATHTHTHTQTQTKTRTHTDTHRHTQNTYTQHTPCLILMPLPIS